MYTAMPVREAENDDNEELLNRRYTQDDDNEESLNRRYTQSREYEHTSHSHSHRRAHSRYLNSVVQGRTVNFFINGDTFFSSKKIVYNPKQFRNFSVYMDYLTEKLGPRFGAVRKICTPHHGTRISDLQELEDQGNYVVAGSERFRSFRYDQITPSERRKSPPFNYNAEPVYHSRHFNSSGKIKKCDTQSTLIKVWSNGRDLQGPHRVLITPRVRPHTLENVIAQVNELLKDDCVGTVDKLYFLTGVPVTDVDQILPNGQYVACRKLDRFKRGRYRDHAAKNMAISPRLDRKLLPPLYPYSINSTSQSSPEHSNTSNSVASYPHRRRAPASDDEGVFRAKSSKFANDWDKNRKIDFDKDQGGVFKARNKNPNIRGAREVPETRDTKTDLPVDHWRAEEVREESYPDHSTSRSNGKRNNKNNNRLTTSKKRHNNTTNHLNGRISPSDDMENEGTPSLDSKPSQHSRNKSMKQPTNWQDQSSPRDHIPRDRGGDIPERGRNGHSQDIPSTSKGKKLVNQEKPIAHYNDRSSDSSRLDPIYQQAEREEAAMKIQAGFRGYQARKQLEEQKLISKARQSEKKGGLASDYRTLEKKIPEVRVSAKETTDKFKGSKPLPLIRHDSYDELDRENQAATTIQSQFRGYLARKQLTNRNSERR